MTIPQRFKLPLSILALIISTILIGWILFSIFSKPAPLVSPNDVKTGEETAQQGTLTLSEETETRIITENKNGEDGLPSSIAKGGETYVQRLTSSQIKSPTLKNGNSVIYYNPTDGRFYTIDKNGNAVMLSDAQFPKAETITIANSANVAAIEFPDGSNILYNLDTETQTTLPNHWEEFEFSDDGSQVESKVISSDSSNNAIVITDNDGSRTTVVAGLGNNANSVTLNWSANNNIVGFSETGAVQNGFGRQEIYLIGIDGNDAGGLIVEGGNFSAIWSPNGNNVLYSVALPSDNDKPSLWYTNATGKVGSQKIHLGIKTFADKCTFVDDDTVICAVPKEVTTGSGIDSRLIKAYDNVYQVDLSTGRAKLLAIPALDLKMYNLTIDSNQSTLYFTDQYDRLNFINLK